MIDHEKCLEQYYSRLLRLERRALLTAETYRFEIRRFLAWLEGEPCTLATADPQTLSRYLEKRRVQDGIEEGTTLKAVGILRSFFRFVLDTGIRPDNPAALLEAPRLRARIPATLAPETVDLLLGMIHTETPWGLRDRAMYDLIYSTGIRVSEASGLDLSDLMIQERLIRVRGKGSKERMAVFGEPAASWLRRYLTQGRPLMVGLKPSPALFIGRTGKRLSRKGIWKNYAALAVQAGTSSKVHTLRHTFATELLAGGADLRSVQELLGHADLTSTQRYTHVKDPQLRESHRRYLPVLKEYRI